MILLKTKKNLNIFRIYMNFNPKTFKGGNVSFKGLQNIMEKEKPKENFNALTEKLNTLAKKTARQFKPKNITF